MSTEQHTVEQINAAYEASGGKELHSLGCFAVASVMTREGRNGPFAVVELRDASGTLSARCFEDDAAEGLLAAGAINCKVKISAYQGSMSCIIKSFEPADLTQMEMLALAGLDVAAHAVRVADLERWRLECADSVYAPVLDALFDGGAWDAMCIAAGAVRMHHAEPGGLAKHLHEVAKAGLAMLDSTGMEYDRAYFLAGVFCHDIGKLDTYTPPPTIAYTAQGQMGEHQIFSTFRLGKACAVAGASPAVEARLVHIIEQAHGAFRHAEWQDPLGVEVKALASADFFSSRLHETDKEKTASKLLDGLEAA